MKILWITNILFPEANELMGNKVNFKETGGWMLGAANALIYNSEVELSVASLSNNVNELLTLKGKHIVYYVLPKGRGNESYNGEYEYFWKVINDNFHPDIIHIHGTEYTHGLAYIKACGSKNVVASIQGMKSAYCDYYCYGLSFKDIVSNMTFHDLITGGLYRQKRLFYNTGKYEIELISRISHIIGRTSWDKVRTWAINPNATYHHCDETLRSEFYQSRKWDYQSCSKHTIFISQATYPIKGLHQVLKALPLIKRHYPDTKVRIAGKDVRKWKSISEYLHYSGYGRYLKNEIRKLKVEESVEFVGSLDAKDMLNEYLNCNMFICPSSIENSPNSLGEAQILGTPCLASYVGGVPDMMENDEVNLYRYEEIEMLAYKVCSIFSSDKSNINIINRAEVRHSPKKNAQKLISIYIDIMKQ